jgi:hypothetical protein
MINAFAGFFIHHIFMFVHTKLEHSETKYGTRHFNRMMPVTFKGHAASEANIKFRLTADSSVMEYYDTRAFLNGRLTQLNNKGEYFYQRTHTITGHDTTN